MPVEPTMVLGLAEYALEHDKALKKTITKIRLWVKRGTLSVAIFGPGGTGKSTVGKLLTGTLPKSGTGKFSESVDLEHCRIGDLVCQLTVAPGQVRRRAAQWPGFTASIGVGRGWRDY